MTLNTDFAVQIRQYAFKYMPEKSNDLPQRRDKVTVGPVAITDSTAFSNSNWHIRPDQNTRPSGEANPTSGGLPPLGLYPNCRHNGFWQCKLSQRQLCIFKCIKISDASKLFLFNNPMNCLNYDAMKFNSVSFQLL